MPLPDVPGFVFDVLQAEQLWDLDCRQSISDIHLVSKEQDGDPPMFNIFTERNILKSLNVNELVILMQSTKM